MTQTEMERINQIREELFDLQAKYLNDLCGEPGTEETDTQRAFGNLIWALDSRNRILLAKRKYAEKHAPKSPDAPLKEKP